MKFISSHPAFNDTIDSLKNEFKDDQSNDLVVCGAHDFSRSKSIADYKSKYGKVIVNGVVCPIAGNICMDQCMVDVTDVPDVKVGDEVIVMGSDGVNTVSADYIAEMTGTINYEITCAFGQRLPKVYVR
jgi:2-succinyl-5-enolpyruvyl-6-hydroxy-3-cyclohexene-1-carboxylate synthase